VVAVSLGYHGTLAEEGPVSKIHVLSTSLAEFISEFGAGAAGKKVPSWVFGVAPEKTAALLEGYFFGDGHGRRNPVGKGTYRRATSVGKALSLSMVLLAQRAFGVVASVTHTERPEKHVIQGREVNQKSTWQVTIPERNRVNRVVGEYGLRLIRKNEPGGYGTVYNVSVADDESYVADGVVVHNCQPFSLAGISKRNDMGRPSGFEDETRGTLFFNIAQILRETQPKAFLLENVKNLRHHDKRRTFGVISSTLNALGYDWHAEIIDSSRFVPQHRERIYIVGFRKDLGLHEALSGIFQFDDRKPVSLADILEEDPDESYGLSEQAWLGLQEHKRRHAAAGHGFGYGLIEPPFDGKVTKTLLARYYKDGSEILISRGPNRTPRRLTPLECLRLQGFPKEYERFFNGTVPMPVSKTQAYKQFGNSVSVPVISAIAKNMVSALGGRTLGGYQ
jgi:DNA (cytosine-5)-methyltransferase 1